MADTLILVGQIQTWLAEGDDDKIVEAHFTLGDLGWVQVKGFRDLGNEMIEVQYSSGFMIQQEAVMICSSSTLSAIRQRDDVKMPNLDHTSAFDDEIL